MVDRYGFRFTREPPPEVSAYFRQKIDRPAFRWTDVWREEHAYAFTVAKAMQAEVLGTIRQSLQRAIDEGIPYRAWANELRPELQRQGWWGRVDLADPATGEVAPRQLGSPRRLRTIYQANLRTARAAGQWERAQRTKAVLPYMVYELGPSQRHRPGHAAVAGTILPVDDPFWDAWWPPNGWGCKCRLRQVSAAEANGLGGVSDRPQVPKVTTPTLDRDGRPVRVPEGIDPGWDTNPGRNRALTLVDNLSDRLRDTGDADARALLNDFWRGDMPLALARLGDRFRGGPGGFKAPIAVASPQVLQELGGADPIVYVSAARVRKKSEKPRDRPMDARDLRRFQSILDEGTLIERRADARAYLAKQDDGWWIGVVGLDNAGRAFMVSQYPLNEADALERLERGVVEDGGSHVPHEEP